MQKFFLVFAIAVLVVAGLAIDARAQATYDTPGASRMMDSPGIEGNMTGSDPGGAADVDSVREAQQQLNAAGFSPGPVNGLMGEKTRDALRAFQGSKGLRVTGQIDAETASLLSSVSGITSPSVR